MHRRLEPFGQITVEACIHHTRLHGGRSGIGAGITMDSSGMSVIPGDTGIGVE